MQFLKTLFWVAIAVLAVVFSAFNWTPVEIRLWGGLVADVKLPVLILFAFLLGLLPTLGYHVARMWSVRRRIETLERQAVVVAPPSSAAAAPFPPPPEQRAEDRIATDSKVWPTS